MQNPVCNSNENELLTQTLTLKSFATLCNHFIFQNIISVRTKSLILIYQRFTPSGCKNIGNSVWQKLISIEWWNETE